MVEVVEGLPEEYGERVNKAQGMLTAIKNWENGDIDPRRVACKLMALLYLFAGCAPRKPELGKVLLHYLPESWPPSLEYLRQDLLAIWEDVGDQKSQAALKYLILTRYATPGD
jgi:hypothetical protein